ncbi:helix-turn-helix transcriptional regulator [Agromyces cerinus]|uniref:Predicted transcriptional regulator, ArsR family n=1 Tax=Agromyces cerinus subsp. cerinus TaxID=232089 RepID=A0A1N6E1W3_9MICO|nr:helix-turn-helix domain-containing protein [Agromyces cerinus]SIN77009.1 Predicted transcriptional regulator, ArsR family [Agromyces cerinus subsp. cerinus]
MDDSARQNDLAAVASIADPQRRALYEFVARHPESVGRDEAARSLGMARGTAAFHLDRLVEAGLLVTEFQRRNGRSGPGAGRPAKLYSTVAGEISVSVPDRHYDLAAELLSRAVEESDRSGAPIRPTLERVSARLGRALGNASDSMTEVLDRLGYAPVDDGADGLLLTNCPFHRVAQNHTSTICAANAALLGGAVEGLGDSECEAVLAPRDGYCCVRLVATRPEGPVSSREDGVTRA